MEQILLLIASKVEKFIGSFGQNIYHIAAIFGHHEMIPFLPDNIDAINARDADGWKPLHVAAMNGHANVIEPLLLKGAKMQYNSIFIVVLKILLFI